MTVLKKTFQQYLEEKAELSVPPAVKLTRLTGRSEQLSSRAWTDEQIKAIPDELVQFAYDNSAALRKEFGAVTTLAAYREAFAAGQTKISHASVHRGTVDAR